MIPSKFHFIYQDNQMVTQHEEFDTNEELGVRGRELIARWGEFKNFTFYGKQIKGFLDVYRLKSMLEKEAKDNAPKNVVYKEKGIIHISEFGYHNKEHFLMMTKGKEFLGFITEPYGDLQK